MNDYLPDIIAMLLGLIIGGTLAYYMGVYCRRFL